jgi:hypothetical protein
VSVSRGLIAAGFLALLAGCPSVGSVQTAKTAGKGNVQVGIEPGMIGVAGFGAGDGFAALPTVNVSVRGGVSDKVDLGGRFGSNIMEFQTKFLFTDPEDPGAVQVALAPVAGGYFLFGGRAGAIVGWINVPVLIDIPVGEHAFVLGPRANLLGAGGGGGGAAILSLGSSVGFAARVGPKVRLLPEFAAVFPVAAGVGVQGGGAAGVFGNPNGMLFTANFGILIGGR